MSRSQILLSVCAAMAIVVWMSRLTVSALAPAIRNSFGLNYTQLGIISTAGLTFAALGYAASGFLSFRFGARSVLLIAAVVELVGAFGTFLSLNFGWLLAFQSLIGLSEGLYYVATIVLLTSAFDPSRVGGAIGTVEASLNLGVVAALTIGPIVSLAFGWRSAYLVLGSLGVLLICMIVVTRVDATGAIRTADLRGMLRGRFMIAIIVPIALLFMCFWSFWAFVPTYLVESLHIAYTTSGFIGSLSFLFATFSALAAGMSTDRVGAKKSSLAIVAIYLIFLVIFAFSSNVIVTIISLLIVTSSQASMIPVLLSAVPKKFPQTELGRIIGLVICLGYGGGAIGPFIVGRIADGYGFFSAFLFLTFCVAVTGGIILVGL
jgi:MFS family permease